MVDVSAAYHRPLKQSAIEKATSLKWMIDGYPVNWIESTQKMSIWTRSQGKNEKAEGPDETFTDEQIKLLAGLKMGANVVIDVNYKQHNSLKDTIEDHVMHMEFTVAPETDATYFGGRPAIQAYMKEMVSERITPDMANNMVQGIVKFTIDRRGNVVKPIILKSSEKQEIDKLILEALDKMPRWQAALDNHGATVEQEFEVVINDKNGC